NEISKLSNQSRAQMQIAEIKEVLRRAGRSQGQQGQQGQQAQGEGKGKGKGQKGGNGGKGEQLREFDQRAGGKDANTFLLGEKGGPNDQRLLLPLPMPGGNQPGPQGNNGQHLSGQGDGIGNEHDPNLTGDATHLASQRHDTRVQGK